MKPAAAPPSAALPPAPRQRLSPEVRRNLLLDAAARIVSSEGVSAVTMERVGAETGVSKALGYSYFGNRTNLLAALLLREYPAFSDLTPNEEQRSLKEVVHQTTADYLDHVAVKGVLLQRLLAEPGIVAGIAARHRLGRDVTMRYFGGLISRDLGIARARADQAADLLMGVTGAAGRILHRSGSDGDPKALTELVTAVIMAALHDVARGGTAPSGGARSDPVKS